MTTTVFVSNSDQPSSFHYESCWVPRMLEAAVEGSDESGELERFVFSELVQVALAGLEQAGTCVELVPFPLFKETAPPSDVVMLSAYLDEFVHQRLHFLRQSMYPNRRVGADELLWALCHHYLVSKGHTPGGHLPASVPRTGPPLAPVSDDFKFSNLYREVFNPGGPLADVTSSAVSQPTAQTEPSPALEPEWHLQLIAAPSWRKFLSEVVPEDPRFGYIDKLASRVAVPLAKAPDENGLEALRVQCPNFQEVLDFVSRQATLCRKGSMPFSMPPVLLLGPPGVGKTYFARALGKLLGVDYKFVAMNSMSAGFALTGMHRTWQKASPGVVAKTLLDSHFGNPLFLLDEIDKSGTSGQNASPIDSLYQLLEPETSASFSDEFFELSMDASQALWVATANDTKTLPEPLLSRFKVFSLETLTESQNLFVASRVLDGIVQRYRIPFDTRIAPECARLLALRSARDLRIALADAVGSALRGGRNALTLEDLEVACKDSTRKPSIGFMS